MKRFTAASYGAQNFVRNFPELDTDFLTSTARRPVSGYNEGGGDDDDIYNCVLN
jgi:hypothetical protein